jgi:hypothetical protein
VIIEKVLLDLIVRDLAEVKEVVMRLLASFVDFLDKMVDIIEPDSLRFCDVIFRGFSHIPLFVTPYTFESGYQASYDAKDKVC